jgi:hypothetical protein
MAALPSAMSRGRAASFDLERKLAGIGPEFAKIIPEEKSVRKFQRLGDLAGGLRPGGEFSGLVGLDGPHVRSDRGREASFREAPPLPRPGDVKNIVLGPTGFSCAVAVARNGLILVAGVGFEPTTFRL